MGRRNLDAIANSIKFKPQKVNIFLLTCNEVWAKLYILYVRWTWLTYRTSMVRLWRIVYFPSFLLSSSLTHFTALSYSVSTHTVLVQWWDSRGGIIWVAWVGRGRPGGPKRIRWRWSSSNFHRKGEREGDTALAYISLHVCYTFCADKRLTE